MLSKKLRSLLILEKYYGLDYLYFGKRVSELDDGVCCPEVLSEYLTTKASLLSLLSEIFKVSGKSMLSESVLLESKVRDLKTLLEFSRSEANRSKNKTKKLLKDPKTKRVLTKSAMKRVSALKSKTDKDVSKTVSEMVEQVALRYATDNFLLPPDLLRHSYSKKEISEEGKDVFLSNGMWSKDVMLDAYKILRNSLVEMAIIVRNSALEANSRVDSSTGTRVR